MSERLKPCPFCGGRARVLEWGHASRVECEHCLARIQEPWQKGEAVKLWNTRPTCSNVAPKLAPFDFQCSACDLIWEFDNGTMGENEFYHCPKCGREIKE